MRTPAQLDDGGTIMPIRSRTRHKKARKEFGEHNDGMARFRVAEDDADQRLDRFLRKLLPHATLPHVFKLVRTGKVRVDGRKARPERRLRVGEDVEIRVPDARLGDLVASPDDRPAVRSGPVDILYRDEHLMAVDKPPFLPVHPGREGDDDHLIGRLQALIANERSSHTFRPALAHRLDRDTSGVVLVGLSAAGLRGLNADMKARDIEKEYLALVRGSPSGREGEIDAPLLREDDARKAPRVRVSHSRHARPALTRWTVLARGDGHTLLRVGLLTGRTHQIRVHLSHIGHAVAGDPRYGDRRENERLKGRCGLWRQFLHAAVVALPHPVTRQRTRIESPLPRDLVKTLDEVGLAGWNPRRRRGKSS
jgi:23S rRNA pseudouridine955/2504/2580 synthase